MRPEVECDERCDDPTGSPWCERCGFIAESGISTIFRETGRAITAACIWEVALHGSIGARSSYVAALKAREIWERFGANGNGGNWYKQPADGVRN